MRDYKASLKKGSAEIIKDTTCVLGISVGQHYHENGRLKSCLEFLKKQGIKNFIFLVADTLQRHTLALKSSSPERKVLAESMTTIAREAGQKWKERNTDTLKSLGIEKHCKFVNWDELRNHSDYIDKKKQLEAMLDKKNDSYDPKLEKEIKNSATAFCKRLFNKSEPEDASFKADIELASEEYIIEECAGLMVLSKENHEYFAYPGKIMPAFDYIKKELLKSDCLKFLNLSIKPVAPQVEKTKTSKVEFFKPRAQDKEKLVQQLIKINDYFLNEAAKKTADNSRKSICPSACTIL